jgi:hypothetical protein
MHCGNQDGQTASPFDAKMMHVFFLQVSLTMDAVKASMLAQSHVAILDGQAGVCPSWNMGHGDCFDSLEQYTTVFHNLLMEEFRAHVKQVRPWGMCQEN